MNKHDAISAVENARWDENDSALTGAEIWGVHGSFAAPRATSHFTYLEALRETDRAEHANLQSNLSHDEPDSVSDGELAERDDFDALADYVE